jgi:hypothetical protein
MKWQQLRTFVVEVSAVVAAVAAVTTLILTFQFERCRLDFFGQCPVGVEYDVMEYRPMKFQDSISVRSLSDRELTNLVITVSNRDDGRNVQDNLGTFGPKHRRFVVTLNSKSLVVPDDLKPTDIITISCDGYLSKSFRVLDLSKRKAFRDVTPENYRQVLPEPIRLSWNI